MPKRLVIALFVGTPVVMLATVGAWVASEVWRFQNRPAAVLYRGAEQVKPGMRLEAVSGALGSAGRQIKEWELPDTQDHERPGRDKPVVSGDDFYRWDTRDGAYFIISLKNGVVHEKFFYEPSL